MFSGEYDKEESKMIIRYTNHPYATFINRVISDIIMQLVKIGGSDNVAAAKIAEGVWPYISWYGPGRCADAAIRHDSERFPRVVIEVLFPSKRNYLPYLIHDHIVGSQGRTRSVIGLDIVHRGSKKATVSVWQSGSTRSDDGEEVLISEQTLKDHCFRSEDGSAVKEGSLILFRLGDFLNPDDADGIAGSDNIPISIPYSKLARYLDCTERESARAEEESGKSEGGERSGRVAISGCRKTEREVDYGRGLGR
ncbi:hypothetical protein GP486_005713 [Trichoglossum hirsutum]|uniref:Uncharacterized protein n=1 Tax=Trichoglossum hirsutum TaxID=265104 RepID=A0A9P8L8R1_9PEZI|nr:hypothetical protein GP486_005713 [Trichoglossum hirsutum]